MKKFTYKEIAKEIGRTESGIKAMKKNNPRILDLIIKGLKYEEQLKQSNADLNAINRTPPLPCFADSLSKSGS